MRIISLLKEIGRDTRGATAVEYGLILAMIFLAIIASVQGVANNAIGLWTTIDNNVTTDGSS